MLNTFIMKKIRYPSGFSKLTIVNKIKNTPFSPSKKQGFCKKWRAELSIMSSYNLHIATKIMLHIAYFKLIESIFLIEKICDNFKSNIYVTFFFIYLVKTHRQFFKIYYLSVRWNHFRGSSILFAVYC